MASSRAQRDSLSIRLTHGDCIAEIASSPQPICPNTTTLNRPETTKQPKNQKITQPLASNTKATEHSPSHQSCKQRWPDRSTHPTPRKRVTRLTTPHIVCWGLQTWGICPLDTTQSASYQLLRQWRKRFFVSTASGDNQKKSPQTRAYKSELNRRVKLFVGYKKRAQAN